MSHRVSQVIRYFISSVLGMLLLVSCSNESGGGQEKPALLEVPTSLVAFAIDFPKDELEAGVNRILPDQIWDGALALKNEKDTLLLKVDRRGRLDLAIEKGVVYVAVPLEIELAIRKKVFGMTVSNEDAPVAFKGVLKVAASMQLQDDWDMQVDCIYKGFDLDGSPTLNLLGISFQIENTIQNAFEEHKDEISDLIGRALDQAFDFKKMLGNVYEELQQGKRIAKQPRKFWMFIEPEAMSGQLLQKNKDTLSLHLEIRTGLQISPENRQVKQPIRLPARGKPLDTKSTIVAYPEVKIGLSTIAALVSENVVGRKFSYENYEIEFTEVKASRYKDLLQLDLTATGDINGHFYVLGLPSLSEEGTLTVDDFSYRLEAKEEWVSMAEWAIHDVIESYILDEVTMDLGPVVSQLDSLIMAGIDTAPISSKMEVGLNFDNVSSYAIQVTEEELQWIFYVEGSGVLRLKAGIFEQAN
ncbi:MAG: DUF4403 family protein [Cyclobacteriaceae bacterium]